MTKRKKTPKRLTKRERKALEGKGKSGLDGMHIHCVACGAHLHGHQFTSTPSTARWLRCNHGEKFASCGGCVDETRRRLADHDRSGQPVQMTAAWH